MRGGVGVVEDVADLQALELLGRAHPAVEHGAFQVGLAAQHQHFLAIPQEVDRLAVPDDPHPMEGDALGVRTPRLAEAGQAGEAFRLEPGLVVIEQGLHRGGILHRRRFGHRRDVDPGRRRREGGRQVRSQRGGRARERDGQRRNQTQDS